MQTTTRTRLASTLIALIGGIAFASASHANDTPLDIQVQIIGEGRPVLAIPGLNSGAEVWRDTCEALKDIQCHLVQLPGFAGAAPISSEQFLDEMARQLIEYTRRADLKQPAMIGHSLGGLLSLKIALAEPGAVGPLVIVDSLPFFAAAMNPDATVETITPMAVGMRAQMQASDDTAYRQQTEAAVQTMAQDPERVKQLVQWGVDSDRATTTQAMYELMVTDLRADLSAIRSPTLVLGAWAAYANFGQTRETTQAIFDTQYAALPGVRIELSDGGYHFLMWDDPQWLRRQVSEFLAEHPVTGQ